MVVKIMTTLVGPDWQMMTRVFKWPGMCWRQCVTMCAPWVGKTDNGIYDVTICQAPNITLPHTVPSISPAWHTSVKQSSKTNIYSTVCCKRIRRCTETTHHQHIGCHDYHLSVPSSVNNRLWKCKGQLRSNSSFTSLVCSWLIVVTNTYLIHLCQISDDMKLVLWLLI